MHLKPFKSRLDKITEFIVEISELLVYDDMILIKIHRRDKNHSCSMLQIDWKATKNENDNALFHSRS